MEAWTSEWAKKTTVQQLADDKLLKLADLQNLLDAQANYVKFRCESTRESYLLNFNAYLSLKNDETITIKVSTYHDLREVKHVRSEKDHRSPGAVMSKLMVMGPQWKEECWDGEKYRLRYWMIFEVQPRGEFKQNEEWKDVTSWSTEFIPCGEITDPETKTKHHFKYQLIAEPRKGYKNLMIREEKRMMFQVNYHIRDGGKDIVPIDPSTNIPQANTYIHLYTIASSLSREIQDNIHSMEYRLFIDKMTKIFQGQVKLSLKRLDCFVI